MKKAMFLFVALTAATALSAQNYFTRDGKVKLDANEFYVA
jgi:hypothetical protein